MKKQPLSQRILLHSHETLSQGVRGKNKSPGCYRKVPNWIGTQGQDQKNARFIPLFLWDKKLIQNPYFYMSAYFERNRQTYYDALLDVSKSNNWTDWCIFFLQGIIDEAKYNCIKAKKVIDLYNQLKAKIPQLTRSQYGIIALDYIFNNPHFLSTGFYRHSNIPKPTAQRLLKVLVKNNILLRFAGRGRRPNFYIFEELFNIAEGEVIF